MLTQDCFRDFLLKRSYLFGFEWSLVLERMVMEPVTTSPWWYQRGSSSFWSKRPSAFGSLGKPRVFSFRGGICGGILVEPAEVRGSRGAAVTGEILEAPLNMGDILQWRQHRRNLSGSVFRHHQ
ncbi:hypothetical protein JHK85_007196 [Glycine max]|nr:hypothetical protein JHK85_007196 [Glycine max]